MWRVLFILALLGPPFETKAQNIAGEWTRCVATHNGEQWNIAISALHTELGGVNRACWSKREAAFAGIARCDCRFFFVECNG
jgi:hypothetical protein